MVHQPPDAATDVVAADSKVSAERQETVMEFFRIKGDLPFMKYALYFNAIS